MIGKLRNQFVEFVFFCFDWKSLLNLGTGLGWWMTKYPQRQTLIEINGPVLALVSARTSCQRYIGFGSLALDNRQAPRGSVSNNRVGFDKRSSLAFTISVSAALNTSIGRNNNCRVEYIYCWPGACTGPHLPYIQYDLYECTVAPEGQNPYNTHIQTLVTEGHHAKIIQCADEGPEEYNQQPSDYLTTRSTSRGTADLALWNDECFKNVVFSEMLLCFNHQRHCMCPYY